MEAQLFRDRWCMFTPNGRPRRKPTKIVKHISLIENNTEEWDTVYCFKPKHIISFKECSSCRPPLSKESLITPTPCTYNVIGVVNTTQGTMRYCKKYFDKQDEDIRHPTPCSYNIPQTVGVTSQSMKNSPSFTIGKEQRGSSSRKGAEPKTAESSLTNRGGRQRFMGKIQNVRANDRAYPLVQSHLFLIGTQIANRTKFC